MHAPCREGKTGQVELSFMGRVHDGSVGIGNTNGTGGGAFVDDGRRYRAKMRGAATVSNGDGVGRLERCGGKYENGR